jgi:hypothetical protein
MALLVRAALEAKMRVYADVGLPHSSPPSPDRHPVGRAGPRRGLAERVARALDLKYTQFETWDVSSESEVLAAISAAQATGDFRLRAYLAPPSPKIAYAWDPMPFSEGAEGGEGATADITIRAQDDGTSSRIRISDNVPSTVRSAMASVLGTR